MVFGVPQFHRFHERRGSRRGQVHTLPLRDGQCAAVGSDGHDHGDADAVETGDGGEPGDAETLPEDGFQPRQRLLGFTPALLTGALGVGGPSQAGCPEKGPGPDLVCILPPRPSLWWFLSGEARVTPSALVARVGDAVVVTCRRGLGPR